MKTRHVMLLTTLLVLALATASPAYSPGQYCEKSRYKAAADYAHCEQDAVATYVSNFFLLTPGSAKCQRKYTGKWPGMQLRAAGTGASCDNERFMPIGGLMIVKDFLTGLEWEQKTDNGTIHDKDNLYTMSDDPPPWPSEWNTGTVFTTFLASLNSGSCFAGHCDWRLPTRAELQTIAQAVAPYACETSPCIDQAVFGPTVAGYYWSGTEYSAREASPPHAYYAWVVDFSDGSVTQSSKIYGNYVRAVRSGL